MRFKKLCSLVTIVAFVLLLMGGMQQARAQFGIAGGLNFESASDIELPNQDATLNNTRGYHLGIIFDFNLGPSSVRPGIFYRRVGTYTFAEDILTDGRFDVTAYEVPVDFRFDILANPTVRPYVLAGPMLTIPRGEGDFDAATEDVSFSLNVGFGLSFGSDQGPIRVQPEVRYELLGTQFIREDFEIGGQEFDPEDRPRFTSLGLRLNLVF